MPSPPGLVMVTAPNVSAAGELATAIPAPAVFEIAVAPFTVRLPATVLRSMPLVPPLWVIELSTTPAVTLASPTPRAALPETVPPVVVNVPPPETSIPSPALFWAFSVWKL